MKDIIHKCEITIGYGGRLRILACRRNVRALLADFDCCIILQADSKPAMLAARFDILDFPRGLGVDGLFTDILGLFPSVPARDENGVEVPLPEKTPAEWKAAGQQYVQVARQCFENAGCFKPDLVEPAAITLFDQLEGIK